RSKTKWNVDGDLLWGYFFTDVDAKKLEKASAHLTTAGYRFVRIFLADDKRTHVLHVERQEKHTPQSLQVRNRELERLASEFDLACYDGVDVGPIGGVIET